MADGSAADFDLSRVISRGFETIGSNAVVYVGLALILTGIPALGVQIWQIQVLGDGLTTDPGIIWTSRYWGPIGVAWLVSLIANAVLQAALTRATVTHLSGDNPDFGKTLGTGLSMILPMIAIGFLLGIGCFLGLLLLIVPGILLWLMWSVVVPVYVQERTGIFGAFSRSGELTSGARLKIFLLFLAIVVGAWLLGIPVGLIGAAVGGTQTIAFGVIQAVYGALTGMVMVTMQAATYVELREVKEGVGASELESIFA